MSVVEKEVQNPYARMLLAALCVIVMLLVGAAAFKYVFVDGFASGRQSLIAGEESGGSADVVAAGRYDQVRDDTGAGTSGLSLNDKTSRGPAPKGYGTVEQVTRNIHERFLGSRPGPEVGAVDKLLRQSQMESAGAREGASNRNALSDEELSRAAQ